MIVQRGSIWLQSTHTHRPHTHKATRMRQRHTAPHHMP